MTQSSTLFNTYSIVALLGILSTASKRAPASKKPLAQETRQDDQSVVSRQVATEGAD